MYPRAQRRARVRRRAPCSGPGVSTRPTRGRTTARPPAARPIRSCSRRRSTCSPTWARRPTTLMSGLAAASPSTDTRAPSSTITSPTAGAAIADGTRVTISGTATDAGGAVAGVEVSTDGGTTWHPATGHDARGPTAGSRTARRARRSSRARSTTAATSSRRRRASASNVGCPCTMAGPNVTPGDRSTSRTRARSRSASASRPTSTGRSPACASTRRRRTPARTSATCGRRTGRCSRAGRSAARRASGWQQLTFTTPVDITRGHDLRRVVLRAARPLLGVARRTSTCRARPAGTRSTARRCTRISANGGGANGVYSYGAATTLPDVDATTARTTRSTSSSRRSSRRARWAPSTRHRRPRLGDRQLHRAGHRRPADALRRHAVHRLGGAAPGHGRRAPRRRRPSRSAASTPGRRTRSRSRRPTAAAPVRSRRPSNAVTPTAADGAGRARRRSSPSAGNQQATAALDRAQRRRRARSRATRSRRTSTASRSRRRR